MGNARSGTDAGVLHDVPKLDDQSNNSIAVLLLHNGITVGY